MFAQLVEADIHELDRVHGVLAVPRIDRAVGGLAVEREFGADGRVVHQPVAGGKAVAEMQQDRDVGIAEQAGTHQVGPADQLLLGRAERDRDAARNIVARHRLLDRVSRPDRDARMGVVPLHMARGAVDHRLAGDAAGRLRPAGKRIHFGDDDDARPSGAPMGKDIGRHAGGAGLHRETDRLQHALDEFGAFELLHAEFAEVIDVVADRRDLIGIALDHRGGEGLRSLGLGRDGRRRHAEKSDQDRRRSKRLHEIVHRDLQNIIGRHCAWQRKSPAQWNAG